MLDRVCNFVEEAVTYALSKHLSDFICVTELPLNQRRRELPERFRLALIGGGSRQWHLAYSLLPFDLT